MYQVLGIKYRIFKKYFVIALLIHTTCYLLLNTALAQAQTMSNQDYTIQTEKINTVSETSEITDVKKQAANKEQTEGVNFKVRSGFENIVSSLPFSVTLSSDLVDFGALSPTNPIIRTVDLSVYSLSTFGYSIIAFEDHPLQMNPDASEASIPDTTCDNGECSQEKAGIWTNTLTYGFGYRCDNMTGFDCDSSFSKPNLYKHFADGSNAQSPQSVMAGIGSKNKDVRLSYKVNISGNQAQGIYSNVITYIAVPNY